jgi:hypothetical protein
MARMSKAKKPVVLTVVFSAGDEQDFTLADLTDWSIFAEDILEIKEASGVTTYIPTLALTSWVIRAA